MSKAVMGEMLDLSANIRRFREERGWSQRELARRLQTTHPMIVRWEQPIATMSLNSLQKLANVFGVTMRDLLSPPRDNYSGTQVKQFTMPEGIGKKQ